MGMKFLKDKVKIQCRKCGTVCGTDTWIEGFTDKCPNCGNILYLEDAGKRFKKSCPFCGEIIPNDSIKCSKCHSSIEYDSLKKHAAPFIDIIFDFNADPSSKSSAFISISKWLGPDISTALAGFLLVLNNNPDFYNSIERKESQAKELKLNYYINLCPNLKSWIYGSDIFLTDQESLEDSKKERLFDYKCSMLEKKIEVLELKLVGISNQLQKALQYLTNDPNSSLNKIRSICEKIVIDIYKIEIGKKPKRFLLGDILNDNIFKSKIERRILSRINSIRDLGNLGSHGEIVTESDAMRGIDDLYEIVNWYSQKYKLSKK